MYDIPPPPPAINREDQQYIQNAPAGVHVHRHPEDVPSERWPALFPSRLLLETGDFLLLEDGAKLLLESSLPA